jgi:hypothetical protein
MGGNFSDYDKGQFLNAAVAAKLDLPQRLMISSITEEQVRDPKSGQSVPKLVVRFDELDENEGLILNKTNLRALRAKFGDEIDSAIGKPVIMSIDQTAMGPGIRLRFPEPKAKKVTNVDKFGGGNGGTGPKLDPDDDLNDIKPI